MQTFLEMVGKSPLLTEFTNSLFAKCLQGEYNDNVKGNSNAITG